MRRMFKNLTMGFKYVHKEFWNTLQNSITCSLSHYLTFKQVILYLKIYLLSVKHSPHVDLTSECKKFVLKVCLFA